MKNPVNKLSMRSRMMLYFAVPLVAVQILVCWYAYPSIINEYKEQVDLSIQQSVNQAVSFLNSYVQNMAYLAEMVENSFEVQEVISSESFGNERDAAEQYYEFYRLDKELNSYELSNSVYRFEIYIPDQISYTNHQYFFYGDSLLRERADYEKMQEAFDSKKDFLSTSVTKKSINDSEPSEMVALFHAMEAKNGNGDVEAVCSISVQRELFIQVMENANITKNGLVYLVNGSGEVMASSNDTLLEQLHSETRFPGKGVSYTWHQIRIGNTQYYATRENVGQSGWQMISLLPYEEYRGQYRMLYFTEALIVLVMTVVIFVASFFLSNYYVGRLRKLRDEMQCLQSGNLNVQLPLEQQGDEIQEVYQNFNFMVEEVRRLLQEHYQLGKNVKVAELRALQSQINPHFLYNTLDLINWIAMDYGAGDIEKITWNLARFYRLSLNHGRSLISIGDEVEHVQVYINIQNFHYDGAIDLETEIPEELRSLACLNIILQPFVENAIIHGMAEDPSITHCKIRISAERTKDDILFCIADDGPGMTEQQMRDAVSMSLGEDTGYGIKNINFRIKLCFGEQYGIHYESCLGEGTTAYIRIPALTMEEAEKMVQ